MRTLDIIVFVVALILLGLAGGMAAASAQRMARNQQIGRNRRVQSARTYMIWSAVISFVGLFLVLLALILYFIYGNRARPGSSKWVIGGLIILTFILILIAGVLAIMGASNFSKSGANSGVGSDSTAYTLAIAASVVLIGGLGILLGVWLLIYFLRKPDPRTAAVALLPSAVRKQFLTPEQEAQVLALKQQEAEQILARDKAYADALKAQAGELTPQQRAEQLAAVRRAEKAQARYEDYGVRQRVIQGPPPPPPRSPADGYNWNYY